MKAHSTAISLLLLALLGGTALPALAAGDSRATPVRPALRKFDPSVTDSVALDPRVQSLSRELRLAEARWAHSRWLAGNGVNGEAQTGIIEAVAAYEAEREEETRQLLLRAAGTRAAERRYEALRTIERIVAGLGLAEAWAERWRSLPAWEAVGRVVGNGAVIDAPFSTTEARRLIEVIVAATPARPSGKLDLTQTDWAAVDVASRAFLSPPQLELLARTDFTARYGYAWARHSAELNRPGGTLEEASDGKAFLAAHPETAALAADVERSQIHGENLFIEHELGLSAAESAELEQILLDGRRVALPVRTSRGPLRIEIVPGKGETREQTDSRVKKLLGKDRYSVFKSGLSGHKGAGVAGMLCLSEESLAPGHARRLALLMSEERLNAAGGGRTRTPAEYWDSVTARAGEFLTPRQVAALEVLRLRDELAAAKRETAKSLSDAR